MKGYLAYMVLVALFTLPIFITPLLGESKPGVFQTLHDWYAPACHQLTSRSLCYFPSRMSIEGCLASSAFNTSKSEIVMKNGAIGYKFPVCARDVGIYLFMLLGGIAYWFLKGPNGKTIPAAIWLITALVPIGIDGGGQFIGLWESTNLARLVTGAIAGFTMPFYIIPMMNRWMDKISKFMKK